MMNELLRDALIITAFVTISVILILKLNGFTFF
jgi:hypothetical protein